MDRKPFYPAYGFIAALILTTSITFLIYSNTFSSPFQFDDFFYIADNLRLRDISNFWPPTGTRYAVYLSFAANYYFSGSDVFGYHLTNTVIHAINGALVYLLIYYTFKTPWMSGSSIKDKGKQGVIIALSSSILFIAHPVQTEAVTYITQRFASLSTLFYLLTLVLFIRWRLSKGSRPGMALYILSVLSAVAAQKAKEISFTLPFIIALYELTFFNGSRGNPAARRVLFLLPFFLTLAIIPLDIFGPELGLFKRDSLNEMMRKYQMKDMAEISRYEFFITELRVIVSYLRLLILPTGQNADYDVPLLTSLSDPRAFLSLLFLLSIAAFSIYLFIRARALRSAYMLLMAFGIFWFFITISIESSIIPIKDRMVEHRLYLPSVGAALFFSCAVFLLAGKAKERFGFNPYAAAYAVIILSVIPLGTAAYMRNMLWRDTVSICEDVVRKSPNKASAHYLLANAYYDSGKIDNAIGEYERVLTLDPGDAFTHYKLWNAYSGQGRTAEAMGHYEAFKRLMERRQGAGKTR